MSQSKAVRTILQTLTLFFYKTEFKKINAETSKKKNGTTFNLQTGSYTF